MTDQTCPGCGVLAKEMWTDGGGWFQCGSYHDYNGFRRTSKCYENENQQLNAELARLRAMEKRLREAELSQGSWGGRWGRVLLNGLPVDEGSHLDICFDCFWPAVKAKLLGETQGKEP